MFLSNCSINKQTFNMMGWTTPYPMLALDNIVRIFWYTEESVPKPKTWWLSRLVVASNDHTVQWVRWGHCNGVHLFHVRRRHPWVPCVWCPECPEVMSPVSALMNYSLAASDSMLNVTKLHLPTFSFTYREGVLSKSLDELRLCPDVLHLDCT